MALLTPACFRARILPCAYVSAPCLGWQVGLRSAVSLGVRLGKLPALPIPQNISTTIVRAHRLTEYSRLRAAAPRDHSRTCMGSPRINTAVVAIVGPLLLASRSVRMALDSAHPGKQGKAVRTRREPFPRIGTPDNREMSAAQSKQGEFPCWACLSLGVL